MSSDIVTFGYSGRICCDNSKGTFLISSISKLMAVGIALTIVGCATRPESISASFVSHEKYMGQGCPQLTDSMSDARAKLAEFSKLQDTKANVDAATVFLVLIPASKLSGDHAGDVAKYKGEVEAIETAQVKTGCKKVA
jgi:hypothetical protein